MVDVVGYAEVKVRGHKHAVRGGAQRAQRQTHSRVAHPRPIRAASLRVTFSIVLAL